MLRKSFLYATLVGFSLAIAGTVSANPAGLTTGDALTFSLSHAASCIIEDGEYATVLLNSPTGGLENNNTIGIGENTHTVTLSASDLNLPASCNDVQVKVEVTGDESSATSQNVAFEALSVSGAGVMTLSALKNATISVSLPFTVSDGVDLASEVSYSYPVTVSIKPVL